MLLTHKIPFMLLAIASVIAAFFLIYPEADLAISGLFYNETERFFLNRHPVLMAIHDSVTYITITLSALYIGGGIKAFITKKPVFGFNVRHYVYLALVLIVGPGLVVNALFKDNWGRARPYHTEYFGKDKPFTPPFVISDACKRNCSFSSGDPAVGFSLFSWFFLATIRQRRKQILLGTLLFAGVLGATRVLQGAHFFSDVIFSGFFVYFTAYILHYLMFKRSK